MNFHSFYLLFCWFFTLHYVGMQNVKIKSLFYFFFLSFINKYYGIKIIIWFVNLVFPLSGISQLWRLRGGVEHWGAGVSVLSVSTSMLMRMMRWRYWSAALCPCRLRRSAGPCCRRPTTSPTPRLCAAWRGSLLPPPPRFVPPLRGKLLTPALFQ